MRLTTLALLLAGSLVALPAAAQTAPTQTAPDRAPARKTTTLVYHALTGPELETILRGAGYDQIERASDKQLNLTAPDGFKFAITQTVCDVEGEPEGCLGVSIQATWTLKASSGEILISAIDRFNADYSYGKAVLFEDYALLERYVITDGGVTPAHISREVDQFLSMTSVFETVLAEALPE